MTHSDYLTVTAQFRRSHLVLGAVAGSLSALAVSLSFSSAVIAGWGVGALLLWTLAKASAPLFLTAPSRASARIAHAFIVLKPLALLALVWLFLGRLDVDPIAFVVGFLTLPASLAVAGFNMRRRIFA